MYQPGTSYTALYSCSNNWFHSVPTGYWLHSLVQLFQQLVTECTNRVLATQPALNSLLHISRLQSLPAYYQPAPRITNPRSSTSWPLCISSLFTGLRLMTGLIMCFFPTQKLLQPVIEFTNRLPAIQFSLSSFASHQLVTETTDLSCAITVLPLFNTGYRGSEPTSRPTWDHLVSRPVTKFNGQPNLPVFFYWLQTNIEYHRLQRFTVAKNCWLQRKQMGLLNSKRKGGPHSNKPSSCPFRGQPSYK